MINLFQVLLLIFLAVGFVKGLQADIYGVQARPPGGRQGIISTVVVNGVVLFCYWQAGALSTLLP